MRRRSRDEGEEAHRARMSHPDPRVEQRLQHILALREVAAQQQRGVADAYEEIKCLRRKARSGSIYLSTYTYTADSLAARIPAMEQRISATFTGIAALTDALSETDLAYL